MPGPKKIRWPFFLVLTGIWGASCVQDPGATLAPSSPDVQPSILAPAEHGQVSPRDPLVIRFDQWLDPRRSDFGAAVSLTSGALAVPVAVTWDPLDKILTATPGDPLRDSLRYTWELDHERLVGTGGVRVAPLDPVYVTLAPPPSDPEGSSDPQPDPTEPDPASPPAPTFRDVAPIFDRHCGCHGRDGLFPLNPDALERRSAIFTGRRLVEPFEPGASYLVEKMLPGYEDRFGTQMPPPWADAPGPGAAELRTVVDWIAAGARR